MNVVRSVAAVLLATGLALAGCGSGSGGTGPEEPGGGSGTQTAPAAGVPGDPKAQLAAAIRATNKVTHRMQATSTSGSVRSTVEGVADPARSAMRVSVSSADSSTMDQILIGTDLYIRTGAPIYPGLAPGRWAHVTGVKPGAGPAGLGGGAMSPTANERFVDSATSVERIGPTELRGTSELPALPGPPPPGAPADNAPRVMRWQARLDTEGRLVLLSTTMSVAGREASVETTYSAFGEPVTVDRPPAAQTVEAPPNLQRIFGS